MNIQAPLNHLSYGRIHFHQGGPTKTPGSPRPLLDVAWRALMLPLALVVPAAPAVLRPVPGDA